jgi:hypothetical protein
MTPIRLTLVQHLSTKDTTSMLVELYEPLGDVWARLDLYSPATRPRRIVIPPSPGLAIPNSFRIGGPPVDPDRVLVSQSPQTLIWEILITRLPAFIWYPLLPITQRPFIQIPTDYLSIGSQIPKFPLSQFVLASVESISRKTLAPLTDSELKKVLEADLSGLPRFGLSPVSPGRSQQDRKLIAEAAESLCEPNPPPTAKLAWQAALAYWEGDFEGAHSAAQAFEGEGTPRSGDYWHAMLHRQEGDFSNANYWFRSVGRHPVQEELAEAVSRLGPILGESRPPWIDRFTSDQFVEFCQQAAASQSPIDQDLASRIQLLEAILLTVSCWRNLSPIPLPDRHKYKFDNDLQIKPD